MYINFIFISNIFYSKCNIVFHTFAGLSLMSETQYLNYYHTHQHFVFIVNPISGINRNISYKEVIEKEFSSFSFEVYFTEGPGHATKIAQKYSHSDQNNIIGVGGDGTINEIAQALVNQKARMGIIPTGSGNGFARHVIQTVSIQDCISVLKNNRYAACDTLLINNQLCCNTCGIGLSAYVSKIFSEVKVRGLATYVKLGLKEFSDFPTFDLIVNDKTYSNQLLLEICNSSQLGNNAFISPDSSVQDGIAELVFLQKPSFLQVPKLIYDVFNRRFKENKLTYHAIGTEFNIELPFENYIHIDGEYKGLVRNIEVKVAPKSLQFIC